MSNQRKTLAILCTLEKDGEYLDKVIQKSFRGFIHRYIQNSTIF